MDQLRKSKKSGRELQAADLRGMPEGWGIVAF
jgi:hypothetical protein